MPWDDGYTRTAEKSTGGDWPDIPDDLYDAAIQDVSDPETKPDPFKEDEEKTQFFITWELIDGPVKADGNPVTLRQYLTLPPMYLSAGFLSEKAGLFKVMEALGFDMGGQFKVYPPSWNGMEARIMVENKATAQGEMRPRVTSVKQKRGAKPEPAKAAAPRQATARPTVAELLSTNGNNPVEQTRNTPDDEEDPIWLDMSWSAFTKEMARKRLFAGDIKRATGMVEFSKEVIGDYCRVTEVTPTELLAGIPAKD